MRNWHSIEDETTDEIAWPPEREARFSYLMIGGTLAAVAAMTVVVLWALGNIMRVPAELHIPVPGPTEQVTIISGWTEHETEYIEAVPPPPQQVLVERPPPPPEVRVVREPVPGPVVTVTETRMVPGPTKTVTEKETVTEHHHHEHEPTATPSGGS